MTNHFTRVPPDSTGNRIDCVPVVDLQGNPLFRQIIAAQDATQGSKTIVGDRWSVQYAAVNAGGSGYTAADVGSTLTLTGGSPSEAATLEITNVAAGAVTGVKVSNIGRYPATLSSAGSTGGTGTGATFTITPVQNVVAMFDTTGFNFARFTMATGFGTTRVEGSIDGGKTFRPHLWIRTDYGSRTLDGGNGTGSATNGYLHEIPSPAQIIRIYSSNNPETIAWELRSVDYSNTIATQGPNSGANNPWYTRPIKSAFGGNGNTGPYGSGQYKIIPAAGTNATLVTTIGYRNFSHIVLSNTGATAAFFKLYNKGSTPTVGTDTPIATFGIPPNSILILTADTMGIDFVTTNGFGYAITGGAADSDTTVVTANQVCGHLVWN